MYGAEVSATQANYYLPIRHNDDDIPPCKKRRENTSQPHHATRILGRKYALTATAYKYLEIGLSVGLEPTVEIVIGDNCGNQLILSIKTWRQLMGTHYNIQQLLKADKPSPFSIQDLVVDICKMRDSKLVKLTLFDKSLYMKPDTLFTLFIYNDCIEHMYEWLSDNTDRVSKTFQSFVNILREKNITEIHYAAKAIRESYDYNSESLVDCELLACALKDIMYEAK